MKYLVHPCSIFGRNEQPINIHLPAPIWSRVHPWYLEGTININEMYLVVHPTSQVTYNPTVKSGVSLLITFITKVITDLLREITANVPVTISTTDSHRFFHGSISGNIPSMRWKTVETQLMAVKLEKHDQPWDFLGTSRCPHSFNFLYDPTTLMQL